MKNLDILSIIIALLVIVPTIVLPALSISKLVKKVTPATGNLSIPNVSISEVYNDIKMVIEYESSSTISQELLYGTLKEITSREASALNRMRRIISDEIVDSLTLSVASRIIDNMSDEFRNKIAQVIKEERIDDFIVDGVYQVIYTKAMEVNMNV